MIIRAGKFTENGIRSVVLYLLIVSKLPMTTTT